MVKEESKVLSLNQRLSMRYSWRKLSLEDDFTNEDVSRLESRLRLFESEHGSPNPAYLHMDTNGGSYKAMMHLIEVLLQSPVPVHGLVTGQCLAAGICILQVCKSRLALPTARFALQSNTTAMKLELNPDQDPDTVVRVINAEIDELNNKREGILDILQSRLTNHSREGLLEMMRLSRVINAKQALSLGLIDEIVE